MLMTRAAVLTLALSAGKVFAQDAGVEAISSPRAKAIFINWSSLPWRDCYNAIGPITGLDLRPGQVDYAPFRYTGTIGERLFCLDERFVHPSGKVYSPLRNGSLVLLAPEGSTSTTPPTPAQLAAAAKRLLAEGYLMPARNAAATATRSLRDDPELWTLSLALAEVLGDLAEYDRARQRLDELAARGVRWTPPAAPPRTSTSVAAGEKRFVAPPSLELRGAPDVGAPVIGALPIDTEVLVVKQVGDWAQVTAAAAPIKPDEWELSFKSARPLSPPGQRQEMTGFVPSSELAPAPLTKSALLDDATAHEKAGRFVEATAALERAASVAPPEPELLTRLATAAVAAKDYSTAAAWQASRTSALRSGGASARVSGKVLAQCRGDHRQARLFRAAPLLEPSETTIACTRTACRWTATARSQLPKDVCAAEPPPCDFCAGKLRLAQSATSSPSYSETDVQQALAAKLLRETLPGGPWVLFEVTVSGGAPTNDEKLFAFQRPLSPENDWSCHELARAQKRLKVGPRGGTWPGPGSQARIWVPATTAPTAVGLISARNAREALSRVKAQMRARCEDKEWALPEVLLHCSCPWDSSWRPQLHDDGYGD